MATEFEVFVNAELPKRISTEDNPLTIPANKVPVTTGVGLSTTFLDYNSGGGGEIGVIDCGTFA